MRHLMTAIMLASLPAAAQPSAWRLAATSHTTGPPDIYAATFVDTASIAREGDWVSYWSASVWEQARSSGDNSRSHTRANCRSHQYQDRHVSFYHGTILVERGVEHPASPAAPESAKYLEIDAACGVRPWLTRIVADPYAWSRSAFRTLRAGGYWPLEIGR